MNKKAIQLSINFLVIIIISIVMLSSGILIIKKYFKTADEIQLQLDEQTINDIGNLLDSGNQVAIQLNKKTIPAGESAIFGIGVINIFDTVVAEVPDNPESLHQKLNSLTEEGYVAMVFDKNGVRKTE